MDKLIILLAEVTVLPVIILGVYAVWKAPKDRRLQIIARAIIMALTALLLAKIAAQFYQGERPFQELGVAPKASYLDNPGFPSDHSLLVFTITAVVWTSTRRKAVSLTLLFFSILVGVGRVLALVHTPLDVLGGCLCALLAALMWYGPRLRQVFTK
ncbi:MAG TPA: phosphatase PAP2 family protein [Candidatus Saccharimonadales bacterium]